jgi:hypothetical protein
MRKVSVDLGKGPAEEVRKFAADLSGKTGVPEGEVVKVLEALGVSEGFQKASQGVVRRIELGRVQQAVREAMVHVIC